MVLAFKAQNSVFINTAGSTSTLSISTQYSAPSADLKKDLEEWQEEPLSPQNISTKWYLTTKT